MVLKSVRLFRLYRLDRDWIMRALKYQRKSSSLLLSIVAAVGIAACGGDDEPFDPSTIPDVSGFWSGQYSVTGCSLVSAGDPFFCSDLFVQGTSFILEVDLVQSGADLSGLILQGQLAGDVEGTVNSDGVVELSGAIGVGDSVVTTTIVAWQTTLVGDTLFGSWRFEVEDNTGFDFASATIDANIKLLGPNVLIFFGCAAEGALAIDGQITGDLEDGDCQLGDGSSFDVFSLDGSARDSVEINLRSVDFNAFLLVGDLSENIIAADDDSGVGVSGTDAQVVIVFETAARVLLMANSLAGGESGEYTLSAVLLGQIAAPATALTQSSSIGTVRALGRSDGLKQWPVVGTHRASLMRTLTIPRRRRAER